MKIVTKSPHGRVMFGHLPKTTNQAAILVTENTLNHNVMN